MAKRIRYYYDEESCTFQEEKASAQSIFKKTLVILAGCGLLAYSIFFDDPKTIYLKNQNEKLKTELQVLTNSLAVLEDQVDKLHDEDNKLLRSLIPEATQIDEGAWNGGIGGSVLNDPNTPEDLKNAKDRLKTLERKVDIQGKSFNHLHELMTSNDYRIRHTPAIRPVRGTVISGFGQRMHPLQKIRKMHWGLDMQASMGTPIISSADGTVTLVRKSKGGYGHQIEITHGSTGYITKYAHMREIHVKKGQKVKRGEEIGLSGNSGLSKGPHLHYEIILNGKKIDPIEFFYGGMNKADYAKLKELAKKDTESMD